MSRCSLIPRHMTAEVGSISSPHGRYYLLWQDSQSIIIQASPATYSMIPDTDPYYAEYHRQLNAGLEIIQTLLGNLKFGLTNWAYLVPQGENNYRLVYRNRAIYRISCRIWAPLIDESELEITQWISFHRRHAIWKGKEVDVCIAWVDNRAQYVETETNGRLLMVGLDLTFDFLGHITRDGEVVGIMLEPAYGRPLRHDDRAIVYEAVVKLQGRGLYFPMLDNTNIMISEGKVRFMGVAGVTRITNDGSGPSPEEARIQHWKKLNELFDTLHTTRYICQQNRLLGQHAIIIPRLPSPDRPFPSVFDALVQFEFYTPRQVSEWSDKSAAAETQKRRKKRKKWRGSNALCPLAPFLSFAEDEQKDVVEDPPLSRRDILYPCFRYAKSLLPNVRSDRGRRASDKLLLAPDDADDVALLNDEKSI